jgi:SET domain-containing protein
MPEEWCKVNYSKIHGRGVFARKFIPVGTWVVQYRGEKITKAESLRRATERDSLGKKNGSARVYIFDLNKKYDLDGNVAGNIARYINHGCETNCEAVKHGSEIWIQATRDIAEGEELLFNYGYGFEHFIDHPCYCRSAKCVGYIVAEADRPKLRRALSRRKPPELTPVE